MQILIAVELGILLVLVFCTALDVWKAATMRKMLDDKFCDVEGELKEIKIAIGHLKLRKQAMPD